ncbi:MAG: hypothetical protein ACI9FJ_003176 [Alteromonadaceae bacterium]|jgi:hypothetical protein
MYPLEYSNADDMINAEAILRVIRKATLSPAKRTHIGVIVG